MRKENAKWCQQSLQWGWRREKTANRIRDVRWRCTAWASSTLLLQECWKEPFGLLNEAKGRKFSSDFGQALQVKVQYVLSCVAACQHHGQHSLHISAPRRAPSSVLNCCFHSPPQKRRKKRGTPYICVRLGKICSASVMNGIQTSRSEAITTQKWWTVTLQALRNHHDECFAFNQSVHMWACAWRRGYCERDTMQSRNYNKQLDMTHSPTENPYCARALYAPLFTREKSTCRVLCLMLALYVMS